MTNVFFQKNYAAFCFVSLLLFACKQPVHPCVQSLRERDAELVQQVDSLLFRKKEMTLESYRAALEKLRAEEEQIFSEVKNCDFGKDLQAYNYWHRGRLKFPGKIEIELQRLQRDSIK